MPRRLLWSLLGASIVLNVMYGAVAGVLVPAQVALADPESKETHLAIIMALSSLATLVAQPAAGAASDRTRTRWGRRRPWIAGSAVPVALALVALGRAETLLAIAVGWIVVQPLLNVLEAPLDAILADRFSAGQRPRASAIYSGGAAVGLALGAVAAGLAIAHLALAYTVLAAVFVTTMLAFVALNPEPIRPEPVNPEPVNPEPVNPEPAGPEPTSPGPQAEHGPARLGWRAAWSVRDFQLVFAGRFILVLGHQSVLGYLLYIVMDVTGVTVEDAGGTVSLLVGVHIASIVAGAVAAARRVGSHRVRWVLIATTVIAVGLLVPLAHPTLTGLAAYAVISGLGRGLYLTADLALMIDVLPSSADHGRDLGVLALATTMPQMLAPALAGVVLAASGNSYRLLFVVGVIAAGASMLVMSRVRTGRGQSSSP